MRVLVALVLVGVACVRPGPGNFQKYTANENGVRQLERYIQDPSNGLEARVEAVIALAEGGWTMSLRKVLDGCPDREDVSAKTLDALISKLTALPEKSEGLAALRDATFIALSLVPASERAAFQKRLAEWAFAGLGPESPAEEVKRTVESRILVAQIADLGRFGAEGATWLIRHGFAVDKLSQYLLSLEDPEVEQKLLQALKTLHATPDIAIPFYHVEIIGRIRSTEAVEYLLDLAQDDRQEADLRTLAFNQAAEILDHPDRLRGVRDAILSRLRRMLSRKDPDDRWAAARYILTLEGGAAFEEVLAALADDGIYPRAVEDPRKTLVDFCTGVVLKMHPEDARERLFRRLLGSKNRVHQALGVVCIKATEEPRFAELLKPVLRATVSLEPVFGEKTTLAQLAQNAADGLALIAEYRAAEASGALKPDLAKRKVFFALVNLADTGDALRKAVEDRAAEAPRAKP